MGTMELWRMVACASVVISHRRPCLPKPAIMETSIIGLLAEQGCGMLYFRRMAFFVELLPLMLLCWI
jgi:hypothetical protein